MGDNLAIVEWPESQYCMGCEHTSFVEGPKFGDSTYVCFLNRHPFDIMIDVGTKEHEDFQCSDREEETLTEEKIADMDLEDLSTLAHGMDPVEYERLSEDKSLSTGDFRDAMADIVLKDIITGL